MSSKARYLWGAVLCVVMWVLAYVLFPKALIVSGVILLLFLGCICKAYGVKIGIMGE